LQPHEQFLRRQPDEREAATPKISVWDEKKGGKESKISREVKLNGRLTWRTGESVRQPCKKAGTGKRKPVSRRLIVKRKLLMSSCPARKGTRSRLTAAREEKALKKCWDSPGATVILSRHIRVRRGCPDCWKRQRKIGSESATQLSPEKKKKQES